MVKYKLPTSPAKVPSKAGGDNNIGNHCACLGAFLVSGSAIISFKSIFATNAAAADSADNASKSTFNPNYIDDDDDDDVDDDGWW